MPLPPVIKFSKLNSAGNDFIFIDNTADDFSDIFNYPKLASAFSRLLCRRGLSAGADGLIIANRVDDGNPQTIMARFLEPDGSESFLCGNGTSCFIYWAIERGLVEGPDVQVITRAGNAQGNLLAEKGPANVRVCIPNPQKIVHDIDITIEGQSWQLSTIEIGVDHAVTFVDNLADLEVNYWGRLIRNHPSFGEHGINANFVKILEPGRLAIRTFEFGVENETLACGTGSAAAAIISCLEKRWGDFYPDCEKSVQVVTRSGDILQLYFSIEPDNRITNVCMETRVRPVYEGVIHPETHRDLSRILEL